MEQWPTAAPASLGTNETSLNESNGLLCFGEEAGQFDRPLGSPNQ